jgi:hypothetical protein
MNMKKKHKSLGHIVNQWATGFEKKKECAFSVKPRLVERCRIEQRKRYLKATEGFKHII